MLACQDEVETKISAEVINIDKAIASRKWDEKNPGYQWKGVMSR